MEVNEDKNNDRDIYNVDVLTLGPVLGGRTDDRLDLKGKQLY